MVHMDVKMYCLVFRYPALAVCKYVARGVSSDPQVASLPKREKKSLFYP